MIAFETDFLHGIKGRSLIVVDHIAQRCIEIIQRVSSCQIDIAVPEGNIALGVHCAEVAELDFIIRVTGGKAYGADRIVQSVLAVIRHIFDCKRRAERFEYAQKLIDLVFIDRESLVCVVNPGFILMECKGFRIIFPRQRLNRGGIYLQYHFAADLDLLLLFFIPRNSECHDAYYGQYAEQDIKLLRPFHAASSFSS